MTQSGPKDTTNGLTAAIDRGDLATMLGFFERDAVLVVQALADQAAQTARGHVAIREAYSGFVSLKPTLRLQPQQVVEAGDVALHFSSWTLTANSPDGNRIESADLLQMCCGDSRMGGGLC